MKECEHILRDLNTKTFDAEVKKDVEGRHWEAYLREALAPEFRLRRSNAQRKTQNVEQMIDFIRTAPAQTRTVVESEIVVWCDENVGAITSPVTMAGSDGPVHRYQNVKVFEKKDRWRCVYWQVSEAPIDDQS
ncbi:MAG TPA: hypothetical protein VF953_03630 [Terriglobales bacterium]|jgi:predicted RNA-binding Zn ribbon-like protein